MLAVAARGPRHTPAAQPHCSSSFAAGRLASAGLALVVLPSPAPTYPLEVRLSSLGAHSSLLALLLHADDAQFKSPRSQGICNVRTGGGVQTARHTWHRCVALLRIPSSGCPGACHSTSRLAQIYGLGVVIGDQRTHVLALMSEFGGRLSLSLSACHTSASMWINQAN